MLMNSCSLLLYGIFFLTFNQNGLCQLELCKDSGKYSKIFSMETPACTPQGCEAYSGRQVTGTIILQTYVPATELTVEATIALWIWDVTIPGVDTNGCNIKGASCPISAFSNLTLEFVFMVPNIGFSISGHGQIVIGNEKKEPIVCITFAGAIRNQ
ncbi:hypothetical protein MXB_205 [Myxobolus squamalis]|nr:hypothetical protein MXB_205 [Myxobolus squamalis]